MSSYQPILNQEGMPFFILKLGLARIVQMYASEPVLAEYRELLHRKSYPLNKRRATLCCKTARPRGGGAFRFARNPRIETYVTQADDVPQSIAEFAGSRKVTQNSWDGLWPGRSGSAFVRTSCGRWS